MSPPRKDRHPNGASPPTNPGRFCRPSRTTLTSSSRPSARLPDGRHKGGPAMLISRRACTVVVTLIVTLVTMALAAAGQQGWPKTEAFLVKDIDDSFNTAAGSSPGPFVEAGAPGCGGP